MDAEPGRLLLTTDTVGGVWHHSIDLARALSRFGWQVNLASMGPFPGIAQRAQAASVPRLALHVRSCRLEWMDAPWADVDAAGDWLLALSARLRPDLVHLNQFAFGALPFGVPVMLGAHSTVTSWWRAVKGEQAPPDWDAYRGVVGRGLRGADLVAAPTRAMARELRRDFAFDAPLEVLPNARDAADFRAAAKSPFVFAAGRMWDEAKNLRVLARVAPCVDWPIVVAGASAQPSSNAGDDRADACVPLSSEGTCDGRADARAGRAQLAMLGELPIRAVAERMGRAAIFAHPARYEPFGLSLLEAGLAGCALVAGDIASLREVWGDAALYVHPTDERGLADALNRLIADDALRERMGRRARSRALTYSPERMARAYLAAYRRLREPSTGVLRCAS
ncbi:MAG: glycosyltransferase family 4 protein [Lautropia sp.]